MHHYMGRAAVGQGPRTIQGAVGTVVAQAHLRGHSNLARHRATHGGDDVVHQLRLLEQYRAAARAVHGLGRTTEVQVDHRGTQLTGERGVIRQARRIGAEQLHTHRRPGAGPAAIARHVQAQPAHRRGAIGIELAERLFHVGNVAEETDAPIDAADAGQHVAEDFIHQTFHRRQGDLHEPLPRK
jgi:hypothetical protein